MMQQTEFFSGLMCFTPIWGLVDGLLILHFCISWFRSARQTGWKLDFWYLTLSLSLVPSLCLLYPFNASMYNDPFTCGNQEKIMPFIDWAFCISVLGYCSVWIGRYLFDFSKGRFPFIILFQLINPLCQLIENNIKSRRAYLLLTFIALILGVFILSMQLQAGCFFNARSWFLKEPLLRPIFNVMTSIFPITFSFLSLRYIQLKERRCLFLILILFLFCLSFGIRSLGLGAILFFIVQSIFYRKGDCSLMKLMGMFGGLFLAAVILENLREGRDVFSESSFFFLAKFFYGNNFSDTRDFAWILAFWDEEYLYGKTYLAAFLSFIPRALSPLREEWSVSMFTNAITGFDSEIMPGLRPGMFGEAFLNFSYAGVVSLGLLFGFALRYADFKIKEKSQDIIHGYSQQTLFGLISCLSISASLWSFYVAILLNLTLALFRGMVPQQQALSFSSPRASFRSDL